jgi:hypothetical protein
MQFPRVAKDTRRRMEKLKQPLEIIGPPRQTAHEQQNHLINIASKFREITTKAIDVYSRDQCFEMDDIFRLATIVIVMNKDFSKTVHKKGFTRAFSGVRPRAAILSRHTPNPGNIRTPDHDTDSRSLVQLPTSETELPQYLELQSIMA